MPLVKRLKDLIIGRSRNLEDRRIFHSLSLIAFFAWVGLGADGLSSSCYGPQEAFLALGKHTYLSIFVAIGTVLTIFIISASYSQIVELFPTGGGGYLVASKLLSPSIGMISGSALLIDYVLTITVSIASGADAVFSLLPLSLHSYRLMFAAVLVVVMMILNMRGVKESVLPLVPIFLTFLVTHVFIIIYAFSTHLPDFPRIITSTQADIKSSISQVGFLGMLFLILRAYSMGAGTYTGIEAVSNGIPVLREPKVQTAKYTMRYMAVSLAFVVIGLMLGYLFYNVGLEPGKTLNTVFFERSTSSWNANFSKGFIFVSLIAEAVLLLVAAQTGFLDGPRVLANMAKDRWFPTRFSNLSDRLVIQNGILIMGGLALLLMIITNGSVRLLVVLYSINVFITFTLSQLGMVRHWWISRIKVKKWRGKILINSIGLTLTLFILTSMVILKFHQGGWITLFITGALVIIAIFIRRHYYRVAQLLRRLNNLVAVVESSNGTLKQDSVPESTLETKVRIEQKDTFSILHIEDPMHPYNLDPKAKTAVLLVSGFNGIGLHTLFGVIRLFSGVFRNFVFLQIGIVDAGNFKGQEEIEHLQAQVNSDVSRYVKFMRKEGFYAEGIFAIGVDVVEEVDQIAAFISKRFPNSVFFGGQLIFPNDSFMLRVLHNHTVFTLQKKLYRQGIPFVILPIRV